MVMVQIHLDGVETRDVRRGVVDQGIKWNGIGPAVRQSQEGVAESPGESGTESAQQVGRSAIFKCALEAGKVCIRSGLGTSQ